MEYLRSRRSRKEEGVATVVRRANRGEKSKVAMATRVEAMVEGEVATRDGKEIAIMEIGCSMREGGGDGAMNTGGT
jgi:hypothetical protein